ncbi:RCC1 domain-containing protein RUG3 [Trichinella spiralis]|uniref:RCC1 domain-containing protein RUG3 n=1 Tax=Trichinella spiralis TaxID=6334 RepID=A0ABR3KCE5_TRISP
MLGIFSRAGRRLQEDEKKKKIPKKCFLFNDGISRDGDLQNWDEHKFRYGLESSVSNRRSADAGVFHPYNLPRNFYPFFVFHTLDCGHIYGPDLFVVEERCCIYDVMRRFENI